MAGWRLTAIAAQKRPYCAKFAQEINPITHLTWPNQESNPGSTTVQASTVISRLQKRTRGLESCTEWRLQEPTDSTGEPAGIEVEFA